MKKKFKDLNKCSAKWAMVKLKTQLAEEVLFKDLILGAKKMELRWVQLVETAKNRKNPLML
jgi:hypothetical protein